MDCGCTGKQGHGGGPYGVVNIGGKNPDAAASCLKTSVLLSSLLEVPTDCKHDSSLFDLHSGGIGYF